MIHRSHISLESILLFLFSSLLALGNLNPFVPYTTDEDTSLGLTQIFTVVLVPYLLWKYKGHYYNSLLFKGWQKWLVLFWIISFLISLFLSQTSSLGLYAYWGKIFIDIIICILLPISFKNKRVLYYSLFFFSISCVILSLLIFTGLLSSMIDVHNGRLWLWGENPNSSSGRWAVATIYIIYFCIYNPLSWNKYRYLFVIGVFPLLLLIVMSGSRGSLLITTLCLILLFFKSINKSFLKSIIFLIIICIPLYIVVVNYLSSGDFAIIDRLQSSLDEGGNKERDDLLKAALAIFYKNPIFGVGSTNFMELMRGVYHYENTVHNMYAYILAISGLAGFLPFLMFLYKLIKGCFYVRNFNLLPGILLLFILLIAYKTGGILGYLFMWYIFSLVISFVNVTLLDCNKNVYSRKI